VKEEKDPTRLKNQRFQVQAVKTVGGKAAANEKARSPSLLKLFL
jgi:hypothetical protein